MAIPYLCIHRLRHNLESRDQQPMRFSQHQRFPNNKNPMCATPLYPIRCPYRRSFLELFDYSWQLRRMLGPLCFQDWIFRDENSQFCCQFVDVAVGDDKAIPSTADAAVYSQSRRSFAADEPTIAHENSCECNLTSVIHISVDDCPSEVSSQCGSLASSAKAGKLQLSRTPSRASKIICDDNRNIISNIDLCIK